ncbi:ubiquitin elongating factor core-domain-containing protein [Lipomyces orientalis]|uniref:Ubiquitin elongating factor core-domain-containing protein n=1 Tax=Lipomyces orientalis TaxID=1233043 RepID=A0ACC3TN30_9ASCO
MSDSQQNDAETIRRKRLAKLQGSQPERTAPPPDRSATPSVPSQASTPAISQPVSPPASVSVPTSNPFSAIAGSSSASPKINIIPAANKTATAPTAAISRSSATTKQLDFPEWEDATLSKVFQFTLKSAESGKLIYLEDVATEIEEGGTAPALSVDTLDRALLARLTEVPIESPFDYLLNCWHQLDNIRRTIRGTDPDKVKKNSVVSEGRRLCSGYAVLAVSMPEMFNSESPVDLVSLLLENPDSPRAVPLEFLASMIQRSVEDETIGDFIAPVLEKLSAGLRAMTMADSYQPYFRAIQALVVHKPVATVLASMPTFLPPDVTAVTIELYTVLGPFFRMSPVDAKVATTYFTNAKERPVAEINSAVTGLRTELTTIQDELAFVVDKIVRASPESRERMLQYFAKVMNLNHKRRAIQVVPGTVSTDAFMLNITAVLNKLCEPFVDATFSKIDRIDPLYFKKSDRIDIKEEVKLDADQHTFDEYVADRMDSVPNFISEVFYLNVASHHYGLGGAMQNLGQLGNDIKDLEKHLQQLETEQANWINSPQAALLNNTLTRVREQLNNALAFQYALNAALQDRQSMSRSFAFLMTSATWLVRLVDPQQSHPQKHIRLPLTAPCPDSFKNLPEYFVENITGFVIYFSRSYPQLMFEQTHVELVTFAVTFLRMSSYIKNPYLKAKIIEVLFYGTLSQPSYKNGFLGDTLNSLPFAIEHLFHLLMSFYIEIEQTGASSQFYDKFNIRYYISQIIKCIWENPIYRDKLEQESKVDVDFFVRFVALLLNDVTYLLDESLSKLADIHRLQSELSDKSATALSQQERTEREQNLSASERQATSYMSLANETVSILKLFTNAVPAAFVTPEIVDRLAAMLDYNLDALVGPKCTGLKVKDPKKYHFNPRELLSDIADVYLNLATESAFILAVARDGRSYRREIFTRASSILGKYAFKASKDIDALTKFADTVEQTKMADERGEEELGEIPDEFLDPLMYTLMEDPVILPSSNVSIDRATIKSHLLSDSTDPFNRVPLKLEDVIPNTDLKKQIEEFRRSKRSNAAAATAAAGAAQLDTDGDMKMAG